MVARLDNFGPFHVFFTVSCADYRLVPREFNALDILYFPFSVILYKCSIHETRKMNKYVNYFIDGPRTWYQSYAKWGAFLSIYLTALTKKQLLAPLADYLTIYLQVLNLLHSWKWPDRDIFSPKTKQMDSSGWVHEDWSWPRNPRNLKAECSDRHAQLPAKSASCNGQDH